MLVLARRRVAVAHAVGRLPAGGRARAAGGNPAVGAQARRPKLTPAGERLLAHANVVSERLRLADRQLADDAMQERAALRIGAFPSALATIVPSALNGNLGDHPDLRITVEESGLDDLAAGVRAGRLHLALGFQDASAPRRGHDGLRRHELGEEPMVLALPPRHRLARRMTIDLADLADEPWTARPTTVWWRARAGLRASNRALPSWRAIRSPSARSSHPAWP